MTPARRLRHLERRLHSLVLTLRRIAQATRDAEKTHAPWHEVQRLRQRRDRHREFVQRAEQELRAEEEK